MTIKMKKRPRWQKHPDIVADSENVLQTVFVYFNENSLLSKKNNNKKKKNDQNVDIFSLWQFTALGMYSLLLLRNHVNTCTLNPSGIFIYLFILREM